jgi:hypothetical protein
MATKYTKINFEKKNKKCQLMKYRLNTFSLKKNFNHIIIHLQKKTLSTLLSAQISSKSIHISFRLIIKTSLSFSNVIKINVQFTCQIGLLIDSII